MPRVLGVRILPALVAPEFEVLLWDGLTEIVDDSLELVCPELTEPSGYFSTSMSGGIV